MSLRFKIEETRTVEVEVDLDAFLNEFRDEADDFFESPARFADAKGKEDFVRESIEIMGIEDFLEGDPPWVVGKVEDSTDFSVWES